jgi:restriction endonuclease S subunit
MENQIKLGELKRLAFVGGQITSRIEADTKKDDIVKGKIKVIPPKAIKGGKIIQSELYEIAYKVDFDEKKLTKAGDIVVKLSSPYDAAYITELDEGLLITSFCIIIRNQGKEFISEYLAAFFNSGVYLEQIMDMVSGATVPMLTIGKIKEVQVKYMDIEEQRQVAEYYKNIAAKEELMARIISLEKEKLNSVLGGE